jgi:hypothetical protein
MRSAKTRQGGSHDPPLRPTNGVGLGAEGFNLTVDSECVRRLGLDFTKFARICLQTDTWLRELRDAQKTPVCA